MTPCTKILVGLLLVGSAMTVCGAMPAGTVSRTPPTPSDGASLYRAHCASCHGTSGRGDGAVAPFLRVPPADLTRMAMRNRGVFPHERVRRIIDGRQVVRTHGQAEMPVWGPIFGRSPILPDEAAIEAALGALVGYLESLQHQPAD